jgi:hypothetical protein
MKQSALAHAVARVLAWGIAQNKPVIVADGPGAETEQIFDDSFLYPSRAYTQR